VSFPTAQLVATGLPDTHWGSPTGVTEQSKHVLHLWDITYYFAIPIGAIVIGLIIWCIIRYRHREGHTRQPAQFQYHIPIEAAYTIIPLVIVAIVFGFMYNAENKVDDLNKHPDVKITVEGYQWGWRFTYPNGHAEVGNVSTSLNINSEANLPILYMPAHETVQLTLRTDDVNHSFYVPEFLFKRDMIAGVNNVVDFNVTTTGQWWGECTQLCGVYHAYMRFLVRVLPPHGPNSYDSWYAQQKPHSITQAGSPTS
jgi:cytochrome c oxidase subunit 2